MTIFFTTHSLERLLQRNISKKMIDMSIADPDEEGERAGKKFVIKFFPQGKLKVIFQKQGNHEIIITAYFL